MDERYVIAMDWIEGRDLQALLDREGRPGLDPALAIGYLEQAAEALEHLHHHDPPVVHGDVKPANLILTSSGRIVLVDFGLSSTTHRRAAPGGYRRLRGTGGRGGGEADGRVGRVLVRRDRRGAADRRDSLRRRAELGRDRARADSGAGADRAPESGDRPGATRRTRRPCSSPGLRRWWGAALPRGTVTLVLADVSAVSARNAEDSVSEVARAHRGHCVSPVDDGPLLAAFASAQDGFDAARELAGGLDARVAASLSRREPSAGSYRGEPAAGGGPAPGDGRSGTGPARRPDRRGDRRPASAGARPRRGAGHGVADEHARVGARRARSRDPAARGHVPLPRADGLRAGGR